MEKNNQRIKTVKNFQGGPKKSSGGLSHLSLPIVRRLFIMNYWGRRLQIKLPATAHNMQHEVC